MRFAVRADAREVVERTLHDAFVAAITPHLDGIRVTEGCELVASSDLGRRRR